MENKEWVFDLLKLIGENDCCDMIEWSEDLEFWTPCGDTFYYATADAEDINEEDLPLLRQCFDDIDKPYTWYAMTLYVARKRKIRPLVEVLDRMKKYVAIGHFLEFENPYKAEDYE